jgi:hypothetical protein
MLTKVSAGVLNIDDLYGFRNRIINGDMRIDQRNAGAAVTATANGTYFGVDRFRIGISATNAFSLSIQQVSDAPANSGFTYSQKYTVNTATTFAAGNTFQTGQRIEYSNCSDLGWNDATTRYYVTTYTINSADTWEYKTITVASPVAGGKNATLSFWVKSSLTGTFAVCIQVQGSATFTGTGLNLIFDLGQGATFQTSTTNTWGTTAFLSTTTSVRLLDNAGATLNLTGVQLEVGSVATPFERRPFGTELQLCQRYYFKTFGRNTAPAQNVGDAGSYVMPQVVGASTTQNGTTVSLPVAMRAQTTITTYNPSATNAQVRNTSVNEDCTSTGVTSVGSGGYFWGIAPFCVTAAGSAAGNQLRVHITIDGEM